MDKAFSVSQTAEILGMKNEETVRRWIREGRLFAKRRIGRKGNAILLEDIVDFANKPPRTYLKSLVSWLEDNGIEYKKKADSLLEPKQTNVAQVANLAVGAARAMLMPATFPLASGIATGVVASAKKSHVPFEVELVIQPESSSAEAVCNIEHANNAELTNEEKITESTACKTVREENDQKTDGQHSVLCEESDLKHKIVAEQIKLIKLKQELAQIQAQISIAEGQIEYYNLLLERN